MEELEPETEYVDYVGVVLGRNEAGKFDAYRVLIVDGGVTFMPIKFGRDRLKKSALKAMTLDLVSISQAITRNEIEFVTDINADNELADC